MKGFVINLDIRKDRLERVKNEFKETYIDIERVPAIFHGDINVEQLKNRINVWNFKYLPPQKIPKVVCSSLSHQQAWKRIIKINQPSFVFEDDVAFISEKAKEIFNKTNFNILNFDLIWLNNKVTDVPGMKHENDFTVIPFDNSFKTGESYIISPSFAKVLLKNLENDLGAVDAHMNNYIKEHPVKCFQLKTPFFCQYDRQDTNIQQN
jgi:GR25 family glycosyltransferase involved in LPS biosynthesis